MFKLSETSVNLKYPEEEESKELSTEELWRSLDRNFSDTLPLIEQSIDRWNTQTQILGNLKKSNKSHFNQGIISQVNSIMAQKDQTQRLIAKSQLKRDTYRVLGHGPQDLHQESDVNLFNDFDFYQLLLGDFLQQNEDDGSEASQDEADKHYLGNADLNLTRKALAKKQALQAQAVKKEVDRRASKNRKIKYVVHDKILNFMPPRENLALVEGRNAIVANLFGRRTMGAEGPKKRQRQSSDDIQLI